MKWPKSTKRTPIGIDVDGRTIAAVQLSQCENTLRLEAALSLPRLSTQALPDAAEIARLSDVLRRQGFVGDQIVLAAPNDKLLTGVFDLPPATSAAPFDQIARLELARMHKCEPDSFELSYWELPARQRNAAPLADPDRRGANSPRNVMAAACAVADSAPILDAFEDEHWDVCALDVQSWAMIRACAGVLSHDSAALLSIGWNAATLVLRHEDVVVYQRVLDDAGVRLLHGAIANNTRVSDELVDLVLYKAGLGSPENPTTATTQDEAGALQVRSAPLGLSSRASAETRRLISEHLDTLVLEVRTSCSYMAHRHADAAPKILLLVGEGAAIPGSAEYLSRELDMSVKTIAANEVAECPPVLIPACRDSGGPGLMTALGLALWGSKSDTVAPHAARKEAA